MTLNFDPMTLKNFSAMRTHMMNISDKFHRNPFTIASRHANRHVNGRPNELPEILCLRRLLNRRFTHKIAPFPGVYLPQDRQTLRSTLFLHDVCMLRECIWWVCTRAARNENPNLNSHDHCLLSKWKCRVRTLICATRQKPCRKRVYQTLAVWPAGKWLQLSRNSNNVNLDAFDGITRPLCKRCRVILIRLLHAF